MSVVYINPYIVPSKVYDSDALNYITAVENADGQILETEVRDAIDSFVVGCKADGIWSAIKASCILAGARTLAGALVPLVGTAPTNIGPFVSGDYNRKTGLKGNAGAKYLNSNRANNADPQNNHHLSVYATQIVFADQRGLIGNGRFSNGGSYITMTANVGNPLRMASRCNTNAVVDRSGEAQTNGFKGISRSVGASVVTRTSSTNLTSTQASVTPVSESILVFAVLASSSYTTASRLAFYSIGESLDLASLDTRVTTLINAFAAVIP
jgi:hypothetical protein